MLTKKRLAAINIERRRVVCCWVVLGASTPADECPDLMRIVRDPVRSDTGCPVTGWGASQVGIASSCTRFEFGGVPAPARTL